MGVLGFQVCGVLLSMEVDQNGQEGSGTATDGDVWEEPQVDGLRRR